MQQYSAAEPRRTVQAEDSSSNKHFSELYRLGKQVRVLENPSRACVLSILLNCNTNLYTYCTYFATVTRVDYQLGEGAFSTVKDGTHKQSGESFAIKIVTKAKLTSEDEEALKDEIAVLKELQHQHIIRLYDVFDESQYYYLVTEKMSGGELFDRIVQKSYYNEKEARDVCKILFESLRYCHAHKVAHRDLKPENLLLFVSTQILLVKERVPLLFDSHSQLLSLIHANSV